jgi:hypothetical protein
MSKTKSRCRQARLFVAVSFSSFGQEPPNPFRLRGDFTPFHIPVVKFDYVVLPAESVERIASDSAKDGVSILRLSPLPNNTKSSFIRRQIAAEKQRLKDRGVVHETGPRRPARSVHVYTVAPIILNGSTRPRRGQWNCLSHFIPSSIAASRRTPRLLSLTPRTNRKAGKSRMRQRQIKKPNGGYVRTCSKRSTPPRKSRAIPSKPE